MKNGFWDKKIPTILGLLLIAVGIGLTSYFARQGVFLFIQASPTDNPQEVRITNITDSQATVSFTTDGEAIGSLNFGETKEGLSKKLDDQDQASGEITKRKIHSITARDLKPSTKYYFSITSGEETYLNNDSFYELTTGANIKAEPPSQEPIAGKVLLPDGNPPKEAIVYATINNAQLISTIVKENGSYILPLNSLRAANLSFYFSFSEKVYIKMAILGDGYSSMALLSIKQINPVPQITLSKNYDFTASAEPQASESATFEEFPSFPASSTTQETKDSPSIISPQDEQGLSDQQPEFKGKALPNETVKIIINSENEIEVEVTADKNGDWSYQPDSKLSPGEHTISIITKDAQGILRTITQSFTVYAEGSQFTDTMSPTPTTTQAPSLTPTTTPSVTATVTATITPTTSIISTTTLSPTNISTYTPTATIATSSSLIVEPPGPNTSLLNLGFIGITSIILGIVLLLLSRGSISFI